MFVTLKYCVLRKKFVTLIHCVLEKKMFVTLRHRVLEKNGQKRSKIVKNGLKGPFLTVFDIC